MNEFLKEWKQQIIKDTGIGIRLFLLISVLLLMLSIITGIAYVLNLLLGMAAVVIVTPFLVVGMIYLLVTGISASVEMDFKKNAKI